MILIVGRVLDRRYLHSRSYEQPGASAIVLPRRGARAAQERGFHILHVHPRIREAQLHLIVDHFDKPAAGLSNEMRLRVGPVSGGTIKPQIVQSRIRDIDRLGPPWRPIGAFRTPSHAVYSRLT